ncbi:MAG: hypothetical protein WDZ59_14560 [Pirellulales bacterium]
MAKLRQVIRKIEPAARLPFEEQSWPINLALFILAGFVGGIIVAAGGFDDPRLLHNGWVRLATFTLTLAVLFWASTRWGRRVARRLQLAVLISLIGHLFLAVVLHSQYLQLLAEQAQDQSVAVPEDEPIPLPEYFAPPIDRPEQVEPFQQPVPSQVPQPQTAEVTREQETPKETETLRQPVPTPTTETTEQPSPVELARTELSAPHRADNASQLSKQPVQAELDRSRPTVAVPNPEQPAAPQEPSVDATPTQLAREAPASRVPPQATVAEPQTPREAEQVLLSQRTRGEQTTVDSPSMTTLPRRIADPAEMPRAETAQVRDGRPRQRSPERPLDAQSTRLAQTAREVPSPTPAESAAFIPVDRAPSEVIPSQVQVARRESDNPQPEVTPSTSPARSTAAADVSPTQVETPSQAVAETSPANEDASPQATQVARQSTEAPQAPSSDSPEPQPIAAATAQSNAEVPRRSDRPDQPTVDTSSIAAETPRRAPREAAVAASPDAVESPSLAQASSRPSATAQPARAALSRANQGVVGRGRSENLDEQLPADSRQSATVASSAANRDSAVQQREGQAEAPSAPARLAKSRAGAEMPEATRLAQDVQQATAIGSQRPSTLSATSSAAVQRRDAEAPRGDQTAAAGEGQIDTGAPQVVPEIGIGRASGGGQPEVALSAQQPREPRRSAAGSAPLASLDAENVAAVPAAPVAREDDPAQESALVAGGGSVESPARAAAVAPAGDGSAQAADPDQPSPSDLVQPELRRRTSDGSESGAPPVAQSAAAPSRPHTGATLASAAAAPVDSGAPEGRAAAAGDPLVAEGATAARTPSGVPSTRTPGEIGALAGDVPLDSPAAIAAGAGLASTQAARNDSARDAAVVASGSEGAPLKRSTTAALPGGAALPDEPVQLADASPGSDNEGGAAQSATGGDALARASGNLPVRVQAEEGPGGLQQAVSIDVGNPRRAQRESQVVHTAPGRFLQRKVGGQATISGQAEVVAEAFARRGQRQEELQSGGEGKPTARTEAAIELGLEYLARHQLPDGRWSFQLDRNNPPGYQDEQAAIHADSAATGMALLAFLGAGYDHFDDRYQQVVQDGLNYLVRSQQADGGLYIPQEVASNYVAQLYSHGIASIALCEAVGMTGDPMLREPAQRAIDFIVESQHPERGGWRYTPGYMSDLSVTGWQWMALKSGELAGLDVPQETLDRAIAFLDRCRGTGDQRHLYLYNPWAADTPAQRHGRTPSTAMTSVGLLMRLYAGSNREDAEIRLGADHLLDNLPRIGTPENQALVGTVDNPMRDTYYWYYATQVMFHMGGEYWESWNERLHPMLVDTQTPSGYFAGSWNPLSPVADKWGPQGGRLYVTALNLLSLEVYYRHLPIYESTAQ